MYHRSSFITYRSLAFSILVCAMMLLTFPVGIGTSDAQDGVMLEFWSRNIDESLVKPMVDAFNSSHADQISLTIIPSDQFVQKLGTAIAGGDAPDLIAIDLIYVPQFASTGQLVDITDLAESMPHFDLLTASHIRLGVYEGRNYALPFFVDGSFLIYNKALFEEAGLDPESPPTTWAELLDYARAITALKDDVYGYYFSGACAGCNAFTFLPLIWASGGDVLNEDGTEATLDTPEVVSALQLYRQMWEEKLVPPGAQVDNGADFVNAFFTGKIGMMGTGAFMLQLMKQDYPEIDFGVGFLPGETGGTGSFAGGDAIAIATGSSHIDAAEAFLDWLYTEETQIEVYARTNHLTLRSDLSVNEYSSEDVRVILANDALNLGRTPYLLPYNQIFNDANGPWLAMLQEAIFDGNIDEAVASAQEAFTDILESQ